MSEQRLIDANALKKSLALQEESGRMGELLTVVIHSVIDSMPTIEPKKGKWIEVEVFQETYDICGNKTWSSKMQCDQCGFRHTAIEGHMAQYNFCPNCGADMRGEQDG